MLVVSGYDQFGLDSEQFFIIIIRLRDNISRVLAFDLIPCQDQDLITNTSQKLKLKALTKWKIYLLSCYN